MRIRSARNDDWKACLELDLSYETEYVWQMELLQDDQGWGARFRQVRLPRKQHVSPFLSPEIRLRGWERRDAFWVAVEHRKVLGYLAVVLELEHRLIRICNLGVAPEYRRQGIASALLQKTVDWSLRQEVDQLILECSPKAQPAISFAFKQGFVLCGFQEGYWPGQELALFLRKRIR